VGHRCRLPLGILIALALSLSGCSGCARYRRCSAPPPAVIAALPRQLSETGLFAAAGSTTLAAGIRAYEPAHPLWSDGAAKRRWISLPEAEPIDTSDPDDWSFPVGTKLWKEFSFEGRRVETRLLAKVGPGATDWAGAAYVWDAEQRDATLAPEGLKDAHGLPYDVPRAADCQGCHGGRKSYVLGFSAVQLAAPDLPLTLSDLSEEGRLSRPLERAPAIPGNELEQSALGYLHANCGHCHNRARPPRGDGPRCYDPERSLDFWLPSDPPESAARMPAVTSSVPQFVTPGDPDDSRLIALVSRRGGFLHMPPLASRRVDPDGVRELRAWVAGMQRERRSRP
jgi:mono/diheme cytochrome c family protein